jgi:hypothetical protein
MTPDVQQRLQNVQDWTEGRGEHPWFARIDYLLADKGLKLPLFDRKQWKTIYENQRLVLWERR